LAAATIVERRQWPPRRKRGSITAKYFLGIDNGSTTIKAGIFHANGAEIAVHGVRSTERTPGPGLYESTLDASESSLGSPAKSGVDTAAIFGLALPGHGSSLRMVGATGDAVYPAMEGVSRWATRW